MQLAQREDESLLRWQRQNRTPDINAQLVQLDHARGRPEPIGVGQCLPVQRGVVGVGSRRPRRRNWSWHMLAAMASSQARTASG